MTTLEIISLIVGVIEIAIALICLRWFYLKMTSMEQNQQILIDELEALWLQNTNILLLEMPFAKWSRRMANEVAEIQNRRDTQVLLAHIERYLPFHNSDALQALRAQGVKMQCNALFFLSWRTKRKAVKMLQRGEIDVLGSDCHNMTARPPRLGEAIQVIQKSVERDVWREFQRNLPDLSGKGERL